MNPELPTALVAGATGYTGREVVRLLAEAARSRVVAHVRPDSSRLEHWRAQFGAGGAEVDTTEWSDEAMAETFQRLKPRIVFALLGTTSKRAAAARSQGANDSYETVDYGLTALLMRAALQSNAFPRFVYLSSMGVGPRARGAYLQIRHRLETELSESGLPFVIARPSFITGPGRDEPRPMERFGASVSNGLLSVAGVLGMKRAAARYRSTTSHELAAALVRLAFDPAAANRTWLADSLRDP